MVMAKLRTFVVQEPIVATSCLIAGIGQYLYSSILNAFACDSQIKCFEMKLILWIWKPLKTIWNLNGIGWFHIVKALISIDVNEIGESGEVLLYNYVFITEIDWLFVYSYTIPESVMPQILIIAIMLYCVLRMG